jgi:hypothetical protein
VLSYDPFGYYGQALKDDAVVCLTVLQPAYLLAGYCPVQLDPRMWQVFADGELIGRIQREEDVGPSLLLLLESAYPRASSHDQEVRS